jgi:hypothetical protein
MRETAKEEVWDNSFFSPPIERPSFIMSYGINDNQNVFTKDGRTTSRVLNVPGGKSSVNLGWDEQEKNEPQLPRGKKRFDDKSGKVGDRAWGHACCLPNLSL